MEKITVDARGLSCPQPVIETKRVLDKHSSGTVEILVDTVTSRENVLRYVTNAGWKGGWREQDGGYAVTATK
ncbi:sulfurtransferase TusA family protein [Cloacibacillus sp. An23]|uniref:sulfurtransferase TusA family protein n=1 Tax=Cloacibacillus sp. An23 TaxID=1965591 RepID=UPI000B3ACC9F|nr:sulfurtransferase TusA family protein [Cloacibacillus sp. An23]OUO94302.1 SirA family protein [Cloacibacillus sp. An23]